jgi:hypothetical protein
MTTRDWVSIRTAGKKRWLSQEEMKLILSFHAPTGLQHEDLLQLHESLSVSDSA